VSPESQDPAAGEQLIDRIEVTRNRTAGAGITSRPGLMGPPWNIGLSRPAGLLRKDVRKGLGARTKGGRVLHSLA